jgi:diguanylate cyclase (GGDEF)-like protein/PAS domain S-box-containing protein
MSASLFGNEKSIIASAEGLLREHSGSMPAGYFQDLLEQYRKLYRQSKMLVRHGDRMQAELASQVDMLTRSEAKLHDAVSRIELMEKVYESTMEGIVITDIDGTIISVNPAFSSITQFNADEVLGKPISVLRSKKHDPIFYATLLRNLRVSGSWDGEVWSISKTGKHFPQRLSLSSLFDNQGELQGYVGVFHDITELKEQEEVIRNQALYDALTGLPNRLLLLDRLGMALYEAKMNCCEVAILFLDLDDFKNVNDTMGHDVGDELLIEIARRLREIFRKSDTVSRLGGDEFVIILKCLTDKRVAADCARKMIDHLSRPFTVMERTIRIGCSVGIACYPDDGVDVTTLVKHADIAMYKAKEKGKKGIQFYTNTMSEELNSRLSIEEDLRKALANKEFELYYQPQFHTGTARLVGAEALIRWNRPGKGIVGPGQFIPLCEENGLIVPLGQWIIEEACRFLGECLHNKLEAKLSINIAPRQVTETDLVEDINAALLKHRALARHLEVEITESATFADVKRCIQTLQSLQKLGISTAIDDFGTGYASLSHLKDLPLNTLKIDRSFICKISNCKTEAKLTHMILSLAKSFNLNVVAEGVETPEQLAILKKWACDCCQGYLFAKPMPRDAYKALLIEYTNRRRVQLVGKFSKPSRMPMTLSS